ncbi:hypothetical protein [Endozoicomonas sp.]|uniref:hypothetical protein n=1 Tax=Endozoicomonas sp. TaxID=1892382 RepID=UPI00383B965E
MQASSIPHSSAQGDITSVVVDRGESLDNTEFNNSCWNTEFGCCRRVSGESSAANVKRARLVVGEEFSSVKNEPLGNKSVEAAITEKSLLCRFKTLDESSFEEYKKLAVRRSSGDNFPFHELKACIEKLKEYIEEYKNKGDVLPEEFTVLTNAKDRCNDLIAKGLPYLEVITHIYKVLSLFDYYIFTREIKPDLSVTGLSEQIIFFTYFKWEEGKECYESSLGVNRFFKIKKLKWHIEASGDSRFNNLVFTYFPDTMTMADVYKKVEVFEYKDFEKTAINKGCIVLPTTLSIGCESFSKILRAPIYPVKVEKGTSKVDGGIYTPLGSYRHDFIHAAVCLTTYFRDRKSEIRESVIPEEGWPVEENPYIIHRPIIDDLYNDFYSKVERLSAGDKKDKSLKQACCMLLFDSLHENNFHIVRPYHLLGCANGEIKRVAETLRQRVVGHKLDESILGSIDSVVEMLNKSISDSKSRVGNKKMVLI